MVLPRGGILSFEGRGNIVFSELIDRTWATLVLPGTVPGRANNIPTVFLTEVKNLFIVEA